MSKQQGSNEIDDFAIALAQDFSKRVPPDAAHAESAKLARAIDDICNRAKAFQTEKKLGMYGRARVGTSFKIELQGAGYPADFVDDFTRHLLLIMSGK
jgi:hypothetical protein